MERSNKSPIHRREIKRAYSIERIPRSKFLTPGLDREYGKDCIGFVADLSSSEDDE